MKKVAMKGTERGIMIGDLDVLASDASGFRRISFVGALNNTLTTSLSHSYHHTTPGMPAREILLDLWQALGTLIILLLLLLLLSLSLSLSAGTLRAAAGGASCDQSIVGYTYIHVWEVKGDSFVSQK